MSSDNNPFGALDKMLFSPTPAKKKERKKVKRSKTVKVKRGPKKALPPKTQQSSRPVESTHSVNRSTQSIDSATQPNQSSQTDHAIDPVDPSSGQLMGKVVNRPLAFYIPVSINEKIDEAVSFYQKKYHQKIDRSAVVSAILGDPHIWREATLDELSEKVLDQLKNRLTDRLSNRLNQSTG